jgi:NitT/TauT family transport system ATP-binding protein
VTTENPSSATTPRPPADAPRHDHVRHLGELLVKDGILTPSQLQALLARQGELDDHEDSSLLLKFSRDHYPEGAVGEDWVVSFDHVTKRFGRYTAVRDVDFKIYDIADGGEFISVLGPSGCGKSTVLNMIAGFYPPTEGQVLVKGKPINGPGSDRGMVFQSYSSFPYLTIWQNVALGMMFKELNRPKNPIVGLIDRVIGIRGARRRALKEEAMHWVERVGLTGSQDKYPHELSGGMRQRVALARTLAVKPRVLLMDEPFGALDRVTRWEMQDLLISIWNEVEATVFLVTHDLAEAVYLGDRVFVFSDAPGTLVEEVPVPRPDRPAAEMQRETEFNMIVNEISAKVEARYFNERKPAGAPKTDGSGAEDREATPEHRESVDSEDASS